ncbi:DNA gyrase subunit A [Candidatus Falkowbacteria bacterium]|nr:DNA gyrase subunit A [Candidatus Falkowbacteria bacterium]
MAKKVIKKSIKKSSAKPKPVVSQKVLATKKEKIAAPLVVKAVVEKKVPPPVAHSVPEQLTIKPEPKNVGRVEPLPLVEEMQTSYLDYAMSVIVARALPDVRDGLKPVHRRILYAMWSLGLRHSARYRKSATVVGEVLGKYHPHGDTSIYDSMVRLAQDFSMRYPLVDGQGNFGSMDGDNAAAMRYTEARLGSIADEMLLDIEKNTVGFIPNYDGSQREPLVLPAKLPNLLLNGSMGIAVGMATNIPPHNLTELCNGAMALIDEPETTAEDLMEHVTGPDFPTGGIIFNREEIETAYGTGKGGIIMRAKTEIVEDKGLFKIIVKEIPYQVNKSALVEKIAELVRDKKIEAIKDLRDESNKDGVRVVIELKKDSYPKKVLNQLFKHTQLQETFHVNMLALVDGLQPRVLNLKMILEEYLKHRRDVVTRRTQFDLDKAKDRAHILEGLMIALNKIDAVIKVIKASKDKDVAKANLMKQFKLSERQAVAILEMRLQNLANLERLKIETELKDKKQLIKELTELLASPKKIFAVVRTELVAIRDKYGDERRTAIVDSAPDKFTMEDLVPDESTIITVTKDGYIKRLPPETFRTQSRGGKGVAGLTTKEEDTVEHFFTTNTHADLLFFTNSGKAFKLKAYDVPPASRTAKGQSIVNFLNLISTEYVTSILPLSELDKDKKAKYLVMVTKQGLIKKVELTAFEVIRSNGLIALKLKGDDSLRWVKPSSGQDEIILVSTHGQAIRFRESDVRAMGRTAAGVRGMRLKGEDEVVGMDIVGDNKNGAELMVIMANGFGKRTSLKNYKVQGRGGSGIKTSKITAKTGVIVRGAIIDLKHLPETSKGDLVVISEKGQVIRLPLKSVPIIGRDTQGVRIMRFKEEADSVVSVAVV